MKHWLSMTSSFEIARTSDQFLIKTKWQCALNIKQIRVQNVAYFGWHGNRSNQIICFLWHRANIEMFEGKVWFLRGAYLQWSTTHSLEQYSLSQSGLSIVGLLHPLRLHTDGFMWLSGPICNGKMVNRLKNGEMEDLYGAILALKTYVMLMKQNQEGTGFAASPTL